MNIIMKKFLLIAAITVGSLSMTATASPEKHKLTPEQQALKKEMLEKYGLELRRMDS